MNISTYAKFIRAQGYKVIKTDNCYWYNYRPLFFKAIPEFDVHRPSDVEVRKILLNGSFLGVSYVTDENQANLRCSYLVCDDKNYGLHSIRSKARNQVRRGLERCTVRKINFEILDKYGVEINKSALNRKARNFYFYKPILVNQKKWTRRMRICSNFEDVDAFGAFANKRLIAYAICVTIENYATVISTMSDTQFLSYYPNNALIFYVLKELLTQKGLKFVTYGLSSPYNQNLLHFKTHMGFKEEAIFIKIMINPLLRPFFSFSKKFKAYANRLS